MELPIERLLKSLKIFVQSFGRPNCLYRVSIRISEISPYNKTNVVKHFTFCKQWNVALPLWWSFPRSSFQLKFESLNIFLEYFFDFQIAFLVIVFEIASFVHMNSIITNIHLLVVSRFDAWIRDFFLSYINICFHILTTDRYSCTPI